uniref:Uncharacterized protein n=1 Tax=Pundamilia nyererei TaxID=303518 RepID=A0A3B4FWI3_9CICH
TVSCSDANDSDGKMREEMGVLDAATLRQQRRLKQAIQFLHKDSADLLPLDGLKKLGTSKQGVRGPLPLSFCVCVCVCCTRLCPGFTPSAAAQAEISCLL